MASRQIDRVEERDIAAVLRDDLAGRVRDRCRLARDMERERILLSVHALRPDVLVEVMPSEGERPAVLCGPRFLEGVASRPVRDIRVLAIDADLELVRERAFDLYRIAAVPGSERIGIGERLAIDDRRTRRPGRQRDGDEGRTEDAQRAQATGLPRQVRKSVRGHLDLHQRPDSRTQSFPRRDPSQASLTRTY